MGELIFDMRTGRGCHAEQDKKSEGAVLGISAFPRISSDSVFGVGPAGSNFGICRDISEVTARREDERGGEIEDESFLITISELRYIMFVCIRWRLENSRELSVAVQGQKVLPSQEGAGVIVPSCSSSDSQVFLGRAGNDTSGTAQGVDDSAPAKGYLISNLLFYRSCVSDMQREELEFGVIRSILALIDPRGELYALRQGSTAYGTEKEMEEICSAESRLCTQFLLKGLPFHYLRTLFRRENGEVSFGDKVNWIEHSSGLNLANVASTPSVLGTLLKYFNVSWPNNVLESLLFQESDAQQCPRGSEEQQSVEIAKTLNLSLGSLTHVLGLCKPCVFVNKSNKKCRNGVMCCFCHFQHMERKRGKRYKGGSSFGPAGSSGVASSLQTMLQNNPVTPVSVGISGGGCTLKAEPSISMRTPLPAGIDKTKKGGGVGSGLQVSSTAFEAVGASSFSVPSSAYGSGLVLSELGGSVSDMKARTAMGGASHLSYRYFPSATDFLDVSLRSNVAAERQACQQQRYQKCQQGRDVVRYAVPPPPHPPSRATGFSFQNEKSASFETLADSSVTALSSTGYCGQGEYYSYLGINGDGGRKIDSGALGLEKSSLQHGVTSQEVAPLGRYGKMGSGKMEGQGREGVKDSWLASSMGESGMEGFGGEMEIGVAAVAAGGPLSFPSGESSLYWQDSLGMGSRSSSMNLPLMQDLLVLPPQWGDRMLTGMEGGESAMMGIGFGGSQSGHFVSQSFSGFSFDLSQIQRNNIGVGEQHGGCRDGGRGGAKGDFYASGSGGCLGALNRAFPQRGGVSGGESLLDSWEMIVGGVGGDGLGLQVCGDRLEVGMGSGAIEAAALLKDDADYSGNVDSKYFLSSGFFVE